MGLTTRFPLSRDVTQLGGFASIEQYRDLVRQNLRHLLLTAPGERPMNPSFGVGVRNYLFEQNPAIAQEELRAKIGSQVSMYLKYIRLNQVSFESEENTLSVHIEYVIVPLSASDVLDLTVRAEDIELDDY